MPLGPVGRTQGSNPQRCVTKVGAAETGNGAALTKRQQRGVVILPGLGNNSGDYDAISADLRVSLSQNCENLLHIPRVPQLIAVERHTESMYDPPAALLIWLCLLAERPDWNDSRQ